MGEVSYPKRSVSIWINETNMAERMEILNQLTNLNLEFSFTTGTPLTEEDLTEGENDG